MTLRALTIFLICLIIISTAFNTNIDPGRPKIDNSDIANFWKAYDLLPTAKDSAEVFQQYYIDKASEGFKEFIAARDFKAEEYVQVIKKYPKFWESIRPMTERIEARKGELLPFFEKMKLSYPSFKEPNVCFAIGPIRTGGTTTPGLILVGAEIAAADSTINLSDFPDDNFFKKILGRTGDFIGMVAHESIHIAQPIDTTDDMSVLKRAINEGSADFLGTLISGRQSMNPATFNYGIQNEEQLWKEFQDDMKANKKFNETDWFYKYNLKRPADLGYFIGYRISESYYNNSKDKKKAIKEIIEVSDPNKFLTESKYPERFASK
jgi:hypothetical protein